MASKVIVKSYPAVGGPNAALMGADGYTAGPTDPGNFVLAYCGKHSSQRYAAWSKIPWGSRLKEEHGILHVHLQGRWQRLDAVTTVTKTEILDRNELLFGTRTLPGTWLFNDFGHMTCYYFKDRNNNRRLDRSAGERIHGEFFHPTPDNEADRIMGRPVTLYESHGCVHVKSKDIDEMINKKFMRKGNKVVVHSYSDTIVRHATNPRGAAPFEIHFYPGLRKIFVLGNSR